MNAFDRVVGALARAGAVLAALALLVSLALIVWSVVMRYFLNHPIPWIDEMVGYLLVASVMLAAADALREGEHIAVDVLTEKLAGRGRTVVAIVGLVAVAASAVLLIVEGADMVGFSRMVNLLSNGYLAVPMWMPQLLVPLGGALLLVAAIAGIVAVLRGKPPTRESDMPAVGIE